ncbi:hypothetical protein [Streptomyces sp. NRRL F-5630]|uniref:hypothetical protein n=1 Tax=unclassified Streptomyces TaxID=2593676 RepID=UPI0004C9B71E|nr:hypothetical protein [Streptomyces sp. NRRL F-5630]
MTSSPDTVRAHAAATFDIDSRLPAQVFRELADEAVVFEFDLLLTPDAWPALAAMARLHGDRQVDLLVIEGAYVSGRALSFSIEATPDDYWAEVGFDSGREALESITIAAQTVALTGSSGRWGIWAERDPEIAVVRGFPEATARREWISHYGPCVDIADAMASWMRLAFRDARVPDEYAARLVANYGTG